MAAQPLQCPVMDWTYAPVGDSFSAFKERMTLYFEDSGITDEEKQARKLQVALGDEGIRQLRNSGMTDAAKKDPKNIYKLFESQLDVSVVINFRVHRLEFAQMGQSQGENTCDFVSRLRDKAKHCKFSEKGLSERIIEQVVLTTPNEDLRKALLTTDADFTVDDTIRLGRQHETVVASQQSIAKLSTVSHVEKDKGPNIDAVKRQKCPNCGRQHLPKQCPAYKDTCSKCQKRGHWKKMCRSKAKPPVQTGGPQPHTGRHTGGSRPRTAHEVHAEGNESFYPSFSSVAIDGISRSGEAFTSLDAMPQNTTFRRCSIKFKIDTGANGNTLPKRIYEQMYPTMVSQEQSGLQKTTATLTAYNSGSIPCVGTITMACRRPSSSKYEDLTFYVVDVDGPAILGLPTLQQLDIVSLQTDATKVQPASYTSVDDLRKEFPQQFDKVGSFEGKATLVLKEDAEPSIDAPRKFSVNLSDSLKKELDSMEEQGIIKKVSEHTDWCSSLVVAEKRDGSLRVCLDPKKLNNSLKRCPHKIPTVEEINPKLAHAKVFSKLDAKSGYWAVHLDEQSQLLTTFRTPHGRYCWKRLPFGLSVSQDIFQARMDSVLDGLEGVIGIADDVCVFGSTEAEHDERLQKLMQKAQVMGLVFNSQKCEIRKAQISFFGILYTSDGIRPNPAKAKAIKGMTTPQSREELQTFLGMVNYLAPFTPGLADKSSTLRELLKKDVPWTWDATYDATFDTVKKSVSSEAVLQYYDVSRPVALEVDASQKGLGAVLTQDRRPVAFASKALTPAESRYSNIERECLAITYGVKRFHQYLYGREFDVVTDHRPLVMIFNKPIHSAPPRLQRLIMKTHGYDLTVKYRPGCDNEVADTLSRFPSVDTDMAEKLPEAISLAEISFSREKVRVIHDETQRQPDLSQLLQIIVEGWPDEIRQVPELLREYWCYRDELGIQEGIIYKGNQVVIPSTVRDDILRQLHEGHQGIDKTRRLARASVFWPGINRDIERLCKACEHCQQLQPEQAKEPMKMHEKPLHPWSKLGTDLFEIDGVTYLLISDYYSKYPVVTRLQSTSANCVIDATKEALSMLGTPKEIVSDNGPQFLTAYDTFCKDWGIAHATSSPRHPQSNGFIERQRRYLKPILKKTMRAGGDVQKALLNVRATPIDNVLPSPAELMFGRAIPTSIPSRTQQQPNETYCQHLADKAAAQKRYADCHTRPLAPLCTGQRVRVLNRERMQWYPATVTANVGERSYRLETDTGQSIRRNRRQLREMPDQTQSTASTPTAAGEGTPPQTTTQPVDDNATNNSQPAAPTRTGRKTCRPAWLKDYIC